MPIVVRNLFIFQSRVYSRNLHCIYSHAFESPKQIFPCCCPVGSYLSATSCPLVTCMHTHASTRACALAHKHTRADLAWTGFTDLPCPLQLCGAGPHPCCAPLSSVLLLVLLCLELLPDPWKTNLRVPHCRKPSLVLRGE